MEKHNHRVYILAQLKRRNQKEHSFQEVIQYSNKLLESLDYLQKETLFRKFQAEPISTEGHLHSDPVKHEDPNLTTKYINLQEEVKESHVKISEFAQQILDLKNVVEEKNNLINKQNAELDQLQKDLTKVNQLNKSQQSQLSNFKSVLQDKIDEFDALTITFSSVENKKNDLEIEIKKLKEELLTLKSLDRSSGSSESSKSASITAALLSAATDISVTKTAKSENSEKKEASSPKTATKRGNYSILPSKLRCDFLAHDGEINAVSWIPQTSYFLTGGSDRKVKLWELIDGRVELRETIRGCNSAILSIDVDPDANLLLCASSDFASRVWTLCDFVIRHTLTEHSGKVTASKFMTDSNKIVSSSTDQTIKLWDLRRRVSIVTYRTPSQINDVVNRPGHLVISGHNDNVIRVWDPRVGSEISSISCSNSLTSLDLSKNSYLLLACELGNCMRIFDMRVFKEINSYKADGFKVSEQWTRAKFSPDFKYCSCGSKNGTVYVWNVASGVLERQLKGHNTVVTSCSWSTCGSMLASCDNNRRCLIWS